VIWNNTYMKQQGYESRGGMY